MGRGPNTYSLLLKTSAMGSGTIIAVRDEARPHAGGGRAGRPSLPGANGIRGRFGVSGWGLMWRTSRDAGPYLGLGD